MSKRFGNFLTARDLRDQGVDAAAVRLLFWQTHYRKPLDFSDEALAAAAAGVKRLGEFRARLVVDQGSGKGEGERAGLFDFVHAGHAALDARASGAASALAALDRAMGVLDILPTAKVLDPTFLRWVEERIAAREKARKSKDFKAADRIRAELRAWGVEIEDTPAGTKWRVV